MRLLSPIRIELRLPCRSYWGKRKLVEIRGTTFNLGNDGAEICVSADLEPILPQIGAAVMLEVLLPADTQTPTKCLACRAKFERKCTDAAGNLLLVYSFKTVRFKDVDDPIWVLGQVSSAKWAM